MTLFEMCDALIKGGMQKERGFLSDIRNQLYANKGDETDISYGDTMSVKRLYDMYFQTESNKTKRVVKRKSRGRS